MQLLEFLLENQGYLWRSSEERNCSQENHNPDTPQSWALWKCGKNKFCQSTTFDRNPTLLITLRIPAPQWSMVVGMLLISRDWETGQVWGQDEWSQIQGNCRRKLVTVYMRLETVDVSFQQNNSPMSTAKVTSERFKSKNLNELKWPSQN